MGFSGSVNGTTKNPGFLDFGFCQCKWAYCWTLRKKLDCEKKAGLQEIYSRLIILNPASLYNLITFIPLVLFYVSFEMRVTQHQ